MFRSILVAIAVISCPLRVGAHDIYTQLRGPTGQLCCGGDPQTGDCEEFTEADYVVNIDGSVTYHSRRYNHSVLVSAQKVVWQPVPGSDAPAHWCGTPRSKVYLAPTNADNPDPLFWTYCAFVTPGGV